MSDRKIAFLFIALLSVLVLVPFLGETIFYSKGEPREAIVAYTMLESGNWILPTNYGVEIAYKPPFLYWTIAVISSVLGGVTEFSARMPSALAFLAMQLVFFSFVAKRKDVKTAFLTSILLLSSFEVHRAAVACRLDMLQVSLIVISLCLLFRWDEKNCKGIPWLAVLLMACATLTKGPVGSIFPCLGIGVYQLLRGRSFGKAFFSLLGIGLLSLIPLGIWFWAAYQQGGEAFVNLMLEENTGRFFRKMSYASHENPLWYNFLTIIWGWVPWTLVLLISLFGLKWKKIHLLPEGASVGERLKKAWCKFRSQSPLQLFAWVVILTIFIFYCIPKSKRSVYLLPIYPFMGMLLAEYLLALVQRGAKVFRISAWIFVALTSYFLCRAFGHDSRKYLGNRQACCREYSFCECTAYGAALTAEMADCVPAACSCRLLAVYAGKACGHAFAVVWYGWLHFVYICVVGRRLSAYYIGGEVGQASGCTPE